MSSSYQTIHSRIRAARGWASEYGCVDCDKKAQDWCWRHDTDKDDVNNYDPRCRSCHFKYDYTDEWRNNLRIMKYGNLNALGHIGPRGESNKSSKLTEENVIEIRAMHDTGDYNYTDIANIFGVDRTNVSSIVKRKTWTHI